MPCRCQPIPGAPPGLQLQARAAEALQWRYRHRQLLAVLNLKGYHPGVSHAVAWLHAYDRLLLARRCCEQVR